MTTPTGLPALALLTALAIGLPMSPGQAGGQVDQTGDLTTCQGEPATLEGTDGDDELRGTAGRDVIAGGAGRDVIHGRGGDDLVCGGRGADRLYGGTGDDTLADIVTARAGQAVRGGPGPDLLVVGWRVREGGEVVPAHLRLDLPAGRLTLSSTSGDTVRRVPVGTFRAVRASFSHGTWSAVGTGANEVFETHQYLAMRVRAGGGRDVLDGSWHDDVLRGGAGRDTAYPDRGRDACRSVERGTLEDCEERSRA